MTALRLSFLLTAALAVAPACASECAVRELAPNNKFMVQDLVCVPGDTAPMTTRPMRVLHIIKGGVVRRTFEDGSTQVINYKDGDTDVLDIKQAYSFEIIGKSEIHAIQISTK
jgi:hypothetical protein